MTSAPTAMTHAQLDQLGDEDEHQPAGGDQRPDRRAGDPEDLLGPGVGRAHDHRRPPPQRPLRRGRARTAPGARRRCAGRPGPTADGGCARWAATVQPCSAGGDGAAHSSVSPPHGLLPAGSPRRIAADHVPDEHGDAGDDDEHADGRDQVVDAPARGRRRRCRPAAACPCRPTMCMGKKVDVDADEQQPEVPPAEALVEQLAGELGEPVVDAGEDREGDAADQHVVQVADDEVRVVGLQVERDGGHHHAGDPADHEDDEEADRRTGTASSNAAGRPRWWPARRRTARRRGWR